MRFAAVLGAGLAIVACKQRHDDNASAGSSSSSSKKRASHVDAAPDAPEVPRETPGQCDPKQGHTCYRDTVVECEGNGSYGSPIQSCKDGCRAGACVDSCATQGAALIYLVDEAKDLLSFDPAQIANGGQPFHVIAKLACPDTGGHPFSMSVDRGGIAWVEYSDGNLFRVSIVDGHCAAVAFEQNGAPNTFGMGFTHTGAGSDDETLFTVNNGRGAFGRLDVSHAIMPVWTTIGTTQISDSGIAPDLTGTRDGELFGYFPETGGPSLIKQLDVTTGAPTGTQFQVPTNGSHANAWAFAHWGGVFYVFATFDNNPAVYAVHRKSGKATLVRDHSPYRVTGAGVSTCAPELEAQ